MRVQLTPGEFIEDSGAINELFVELVPACQASG